jgi:hypothetical protein
LSPKKSHGLLKCSGAHSPSLHLAVRFTFALADNVKLQHYLWESPSPRSLHGAGGGGPLDVFLGRVDATTRPSLEPLLGVWRSLPRNTCPAIIEVGSHDSRRFSPAIFEGNGGNEHGLCLSLLAALLLELGKTSLLR